MARSIRTWLRLAVLAAAAAFMAVPAMEAAAGVDLPKLDLGKIASQGGKCVEETQNMRRNHMDFLKHHRDETMRKGIRTTKHSLKKCVECHASEKTGSVASSKEDFCAACHSYASVKLDCWDCHATKPGRQPAQQSLMPGVSPLMGAAQNGGSGESK